MEKQIEICAETVVQGGGRAGAFGYAPEFCQPALEAERLALENEWLAQELQKLRESERLRTELISNVSHELRSPLASIKGFVTALMQPGVKWEKNTQLDFLQTIDQEADRLSRLISDLSDMSRLEAGMLNLEKDECQISEILESVSGTLDRLTERYRLNIRISETLPLVFVDSVRIGQVLTNLVENATKCSEEHTDITIEAHLIGGEVVISVADKGDGIPGELLEKVFDRFFRVKSGLGARKKGSGLGLPICRGIIGSHEGRIWVESVVGEGSKFSFSLPVSKREE